MWKNPPCKNTAVTNGIRVTGSAKLTNWGIKEYWMINASVLGAVNSWKKIKVFKAIIAIVKKGNLLDLIESDIGNI